MFLLENPSSMFASSFSPVSILRRAVSMAALLVGLTQCGDSEKGPVGLHDQRIESFAGGHVKLVWTQTAAAGECDTFATSNRLLLMGLDTRDGRGERKVLEKTANYSRPLLSPDGATILFTDKGVTRDGKVKSFDPVIYLTDWTGRAPERIQEGYACDIWRDPKTGRDWVYAVTGLEPTPQLALLGNRAGAISPERSQHCGGGSGKHARVSRQHPALAEWSRHERAGTVAKGRPV